MIKLVISQTATSKSICGNLNSRFRKRDTRPPALVLAPLKLLLLEAYAGREAAYGFECDALDIDMSGKSFALFRGASTDSGKDGVRLWAVAE